MSENIKKEAGNHLSHKCLLVVLRQRPTLVLVAQWPEEELIWSGKIYHDIGSGDWTGYYDWLRSFEGNVIGVRYWPCEETAFFLNAVDQFPYTVTGTIQNQLYLEIYFSSDRRVDYQRSNDYDFVYSRIFSSDLGEYIISFDTGSLTNVELESLIRSSDAEWLP